jgi:hydrogenase maturation protease
MKANRRQSTLLIGFGNSGRSDDGLGPGFAWRMERCCTGYLRTEAAPQLMPEHAEIVAACDAVIFADAALSIPPPFVFRSLPAASRHAFSTHSFSPESLLSIVREFFGKTPAAYLLAIRGYDFEIGEALTEAAVENMKAAERFLKGFLDFLDAATSLNYTHHQLNGSLQEQNE